MRPFSKIRKKIETLFLATTLRYNNNKMGSCASKQNICEESMPNRASAVRDDRPYEERSRQEVRDSEARQMINHMNGRW